MARLTSSDYRAMLEFIWVAHQVEGPEPFLEPILEELGRLIPSSAVCFRDWDVNGQHRAFVAAEEPDLVLRIWGRYPSILWIAPGTVRKHLDNVYAKLGVANRAEAVARMMRNGSTPG